MEKRLRGGGNQPVQFSDKYYDRNTNTSDRNIRLMKGEKRGVPDNVQVILITCAGYTRQGN